MARYTTAQLFGNDDLANKVEWQESRGNQNAVSPKGAFGVMQLMPDTAKDPGFGVQPLNPNADNPEEENRRVGRDYLDAMLKRYGGDKEAALVAYNWGPVKADKWVSGGKTGKLPAETQGYVKNILGSQEPMRLGPPETKKRYSTQELFGAKPAPAEEAAPPAPAGDFSLDNQMPLPQPPVTAKGLVKSGASGLQRGATYLLGATGDAGEMARNAIKGYTGLDMPRGSMGPMFGGPTSNELQGAYDAVGGPTHKPENVAEEYAATVGEFAPAAIGGAGGVARRVAQAVVPGVLSETGGQIGRQISPDAEAMGRTVGGIYGAFKTSGKAIPKGPKTTDQVKVLSQDNYDLAEQAGLQIRGESFFNFTRSLANDKVVKSLRLNPQLHPKLAAVTEDITNLISGPPKQGAMSAMTGVTKRWTPGTMNLETFDNVRRNMLAAAKSADPDERRVAGHMIDKMDDWFDNLKATDVSSGNHAQAAKAMHDARRLWREFRKSEEIDTIINVAKERAGQFSLSGSANAIKTGFRQLAIKIDKDPRTARRFTDHEKELIRELSRGGKMENLLFVIAKLSPRGAIGILTGAGGMYTENTGTAGAALTAGEAARMIGGMLARRKAGRLGQLVRGGGRMTPSAPGVPAITANTLIQDQEPR
jgi:hypothetical protein